MKDQEKQAGRIHLVIMTLMWAGVILAALLFFNPFSGFDTEFTRESVEKQRIIFQMQEKFAANYRLISGKITSEVSKARYQHSIILELADQINDLRNNITSENAGKAHGAYWLSSNILQTLLDRRQKIGAENKRYELLEKNANDCKTGLESIKGI